MSITIDDVVTEIDDGDDQPDADASLNQAQLASIANMAADLVMGNDDLVERIVDVVLQRLRERALVD